MKIDFKQGWVMAYVAAVAVIPPLKVGEKFIFFAELLLLPLFIGAFLKIRRADLNSDLLRRFLWLSLSLLIAFFFGRYRGDMGSQITVYDWSQVQDAFNFKVEIIKLFRWLTVFASPLFVFIWMREDKNQNFKGIFLNSILFFGGLSCLITMAAQGGLFALQNIYPFNHDINWLGRSYGTFPSPLEASLFYALLAVLSFQTFFNTSQPKLKGGVFCIFILSLACLALTKSATGLICMGFGMAASLLIKFKKRPSPLFLISFIAIIGGALFFADQFFSDDWIIHKIGNFSTRFLMWKKWALTGFSHPLILLGGMGFTKLVVDNSFLMLLVYGGIFLCFTFWRYFLKLLRSLTIADVPVFTIWFVSWFSLDSMGYWGIGRICWIYLGLSLLSKQNTNLKGSQGA